MIMAGTYNFSIAESTKSLFCKNWNLKYSEDVRNLSAKRWEPRIKPKKQTANAGDRKQTKKGQNPKWDFASSDSQDLTSLFVVICKLLMT